VGSALNRWSSSDVPIDVLLDVDAWDDKGRTVVELTGELDLFTAPVLRDELQRVADAGAHRVVVVMSGVTCLDSSGLGVLIGAVKRAAAGGGGLCLAGADDRTLRMLHITGLIRVMPAFPGLEEAFGWLDALPGSGVAAARRSAPGP
jgi:anti-sigma B factor antagonist